MGVFLTIFLVFWIHHKLFHQQIIVGINIWFIVASKYTSEVALVSITNNNHHFITKCCLCSFFFCFLNTFLFPSRANYG